MAHVHATASKDNAAVYLESVPALAQLPALGGRVIVKPLAWAHLPLASEMGGVGTALAM